MWPFCFDYLAPYQNQGKTTKEAYCKCGGGKYVAAVSESPSNIPSALSSQCLDESYWYFQC